MAIPLWLGFVNTALSYILCNLHLTDPLLEGDAVPVSTAR